MVVQLERRLFTTDEYHRMIEAGILSEDDRVELIRGEIVQMPSVGPDHAACVARLTILFAELLGRRVVIWTQNPIVLPDNSEPEPDLALLEPRDDFYARGLLTPGSVLLVIEVSETTLVSDRNVKLPLYAQAGISTAWIIAINAGFVEVYSNPVGGSYQSMIQLKRGESVVVPGFEGVRVRVDDILG